MTNLVGVYDPKPGHVSLAIHLLLRNQKHLVLQEYI